MDNSWQAIPYLLNEVRKARGMSQEQLAHLVGEKQGNVSRSLAGRYPMTTDRLVRYMDALGVTWQFGFRDADDDFARAISEAMQRLTGPTGGKSDN